MTVGNVAVRLSAAPPDSRYGAPIFHDFAKQICLTTSNVL